MARLFARFPTNETAIEVALKIIPLCAPHMVPAQDIPILAELQIYALEAFSQLENPSLIEPALHFIVILWEIYPQSLPASSNTKLLSQFIITALDSKLGSTLRVQEAISCGKDFVVHLMRTLSNSQLKALEAEGVYKQLRALIMNHHDVMTVEDIKQIVIGVGTFAEVKPCAMSFLEENCYVGFVQSALKYPNNDDLQTLIWQLFTVLCNHEKKLAEGLFEADILSSIETLIQAISAPQFSLIRFMYICCYVSSTLCVNACLGNRTIMNYLIDTITPYINSSSDDSSLKLPPLESITCTCDILATLCKTQQKNLATVLDLKIITHLEDLTRRYPEFSLLQTCIAIESLINAFPPRSSDLFWTLSPTFSSQAHHIFIKDMLSDSRVISDTRFIKIIYITFQKLLKPITGEARDYVYSRDFLEFYSICFIRDTITFPSVMARIAFCTHYFIFDMRTVETISSLNHLSFHTTVANLLQNSLTTEDTYTTMSLLASMVGKYYEFLKDVRPFLEVHVLDLILDKAMVCGVPGRRVQFCDDFGRIMLNMTADKELSLELYNQGYLERLVKIVDEKSVTDVKKSIIHAIGNIALGGQNVKQVLLDKQFYNTLFSILQKEVKTGNSNLLSACCRVLHILASGDWAKRKFVECGCIDILLNILRLRKDTVEIRWRPLGLLSSLGFMAVTNRRYILTDQVIEVVASMLKTSTNAKVISYTTLVFLGSDELDQGARKLRDLGVVEHLQRVMDNPSYVKSAPDLERWGLHVLEKQNLYTISIPKLSLYPVSRSPPNHLSDWPPYIPLKSQGSEDTNLPGASQVNKLLSLDDSCFLSHTPQSFELSLTVKERLGQLGLDTNKPLFRIGRMYGSTHGLCSNCDKEGTSEELVIRPLGITIDQYQDLIDNGWYRRGGVKLFRLRHNHRMECCDWETRVLVKEFDHRKHKSYKKVLKRMPVERITVETKPAHFDREAFDLYNQYHLKKHDKPLKSEYSYCEHIVNTPTSLQTVDGMECGTYHQLYRLDGKLVAVGVIDIVPKGIVSIYMWYDVTKEISKYSFGVYSALKEIEMVKGLSGKHPKVQFYYLQGWNENNKKLNYKARYEPEEFYCPCIISEWTISLEGVTEARKEFVEEKVSAKKEGNGAEPPSKVLIDQVKGGGDANDGGDGTKEVSQTGKITLNDVDSSKTKSIECDTYPVDCERYKQLTGRNTVDISKVVVCLNYVEYMHLETLFDRYSINESQRDIIETRLKELYVSMSPSLSSQLVIDMMASESLDT